MKTLGGSAFVEFSTKSTQIIFETFPKAFYKWEKKQIKSSYWNFPFMIQV